VEILTEYSGEGNKSASDEQELGVRRWGRRAGGDQCPSFQKLPDLRHNEY
jgi:hypothetical protein